MKYLSLIFILILLSGCSSRSLSEQIAERALEHATGTDISYNGASCPNIKRNCSGGNYEEWYQKDGKLACACNN
ncbi:hypothetical protein ESZ36_18000 [Colwellia demingiae]|uniref:Lipoprotein n=1 Tax=Colwellia demingiae TaxID=89401 RepID=A0A5C6Q9C0_9GAMM|nr:hypothetical protein [Colwellia demingiae]TWX65177.1 hypothetical protein ESZ36_18000 [Colwellia demingiae]